MLGRGQHQAFLYDKGGERRIEEFGSFVKIEWGRQVNGMSQATLTLAPSSCAFLGQVRAMRHELHVHRNGERVWEGPIYRVAATSLLATIEAYDVFLWPNRRGHRGRFAVANGVNEAAFAVKQAMAFDPTPNVVDFIVQRPDGAPTVTVAYNAEDGTYGDLLDDLADEGVSYTAVGRAMVFWPADRQLGQTALLRTGEDVTGEVEVVEDGLALATRPIATGGQTFGASAPEPFVTNYATNPSVEASLDGYTPSNAYFVLTRPGGTWGTGKFVGQATAKPPTKGSMPAAKFNTLQSEWESVEALFNMRGQALSVSEGELLSASLDAVSIGAHPGRLGLRLVGIDAAGEVQDRAFQEGPPVRLDPKDRRQLFVSGTVPDGITAAFVEVFRNATEDDDKAKWVAGDGCQFDRFGWWRGRAEAWFDGSQADTEDYDYAWSGAPGVSRSTRTYKHPVPDAYYGLVEQVFSMTTLTTRVELEAAARSVRKASDPCPITVNVPPNTALNPNAPVTISELVAGTTVPVEVTTGPRMLRADCVLDSINVVQDDKGEQVTVTLLAGQAWEVDY